MKMPVFIRKMHHWTSIVIALPVMIVIVTGLLLQVRKQVAWVQPTEQRGSPGDPKVSLDQILAACQAIPEAAIKTWKDIERVDLRPAKGMLKVKSRNNIEIQLDAQSGNVLQVALRRSDIITDLHEGSWFASWTQWGLFLPAAILLLGMWFSGMYLFFYPRFVKARRANGSVS